MATRSPELSADDRQYIRLLSNALGRGVRMPLYEAETIELFLSMGYTCNERLIEILLGTRQDSYACAELRRFNTLLEQKKLWKRWPNQHHDYKKSTGTLALEIAEVWPQLPEESKQNWIDAWPPAVVLALCCGCVDSDAQFVWMDISSRKFLASA